MCVLYPFLLSIWLSAVAGCLYHTVSPPFLSPLAQNSFEIIATQSGPWGNISIVSSNVVVNNDSIDILFIRWNSTYITSGSIKPKQESNSSNVFSALVVFDFSFALINVQPADGYTRYPSLRIEKKSIAPSGSNLNTDTYDVIFLTLRPAAPAYTAFLRTVRNATAGKQKTGNFSTTNETSASIRIVWTATDISVWRMDTTTPYAFISYSTADGPIPSQPGSWQIYANGESAMTGTFSFYGNAISCSTNLTTFPPLPIPTPTLLILPPPTNLSPAPSSASCLSSIPGSVCSNGQVIVPGDWQTVNGTTDPVQIAEPLIITGDVRSESPLNIEVTTANVSGSAVSVYGCANLTGSTITFLNPPKELGSLPVLDTECLQSNFSSIRIIDNTTCLLEQEGIPIYDGVRMTVLFTPTEKLHCSKSKDSTKTIVIIAVGVVVAVLIVAAVAIFFWIYFHEGHRQKGCLRVLFRSGDRPRHGVRRTVSATLTPRAS